MIDIQLATRCEIGRRAGNEDDLRSGRAGGTCYAILSDGAGGHHNGAEASRRVVEHVADALHAETELAPRVLDTAVCGAHEGLQRLQGETSGAQRMHATVVVFWADLHSECALWTHVGDSRLYRLRNGVVDYVTRDDSVVQRMVDAGALTPEQAREHPRKNQLVAALGMADALEPHTLPQPAEIEDGDAYLLCTDGWWEPLSAAELAATLSSAVSPDDWLDGMERLIEQQARPRQDNYSAIAVWVGDPASTTRFRLGGEETTEWG